MIKLMIFLMILSNIEFFQNYSVKTLGTEMQRTWSIFQQFILFLELCIFIELRYLNEDNILQHESLSRASFFCIHPLTRRAVPLIKALRALQFRLSILSISHKIPTRHTYTALPHKYKYVGVRYQKYLWE